LIVKKGARKAAFTPANQTQSAWLIAVMPIMPWQKPKRLAPDAMTYRLARKRALEKSGLQHVAGWLPKDRADEIAKEIEAEKPKVTEVLKNEK